jgi:hypothetical protein
MSTPCPLPKSCAAELQLYPVYKTLAKIWKILPRLDFRTAEGEASGFAGIFQD